MTSLEGASLAVAGGSTLKQIFFLTFSFIHLIIWIWQKIACTAADDLSWVTGDCTKFLRCIYGTFYAMSCTTGSNFDYVRKTCDTPVKAVCLGATTTVATTPTTTLGAGSSKK